MSPQRDLPTMAVGVALLASFAVLAVWLLVALVGWLGQTVGLEIVLWCAAGLFFAAALASACAAGWLWGERDVLRARNGDLERKILELRSTLAEERRQAIRGRWGP